MVTSGDDCRIVNVTSVAHKGGDFRTNDISLSKLNETNFNNGTDAYHISKLYQVFITTYNFK